MRPQGGASFCARFRPRFFLNMFSTGLPRCGCFVAQAQGGARWRKLWRNVPAKLSSKKLALPCLKSYHCHVSFLLSTARAHVSDRGMPNATLQQGNEQRSYMYIYNTIYIYIIHLSLYIYIYIFLFFCFCFSLSRLCFESLQIAQLLVRWRQNDLEFNCKPSQFAGRQHNSE